MTRIGNRAVNAAVRDALDHGAPGRMSSTELRDIKNVALDQMEHASRPSTTLNNIERSFERANDQTDGRYAQRFARFLEELGRIAGEAPATTASPIAITGFEKGWDSGGLSANIVDGNLKLRGVLNQEGVAKVKLGSRTISIPIAPPVHVKQFIEKLRDALPNNDVLVKSHQSGTYTVQVWPKGQAPRPDDAPVYAIMETVRGFMAPGTGSLSFKLDNVEIAQGETRRLRVDNKVYEVKGSASIKNTNDALYALRDKLRADGLDAEVKPYSRYPTTFIVKAGS